METLLAILLAKLLTQAPADVGLHPEIYRQNGETIRCVIVTQREAHYKKSHATACLNRNTGEVLGVILTRNGTPRCPIAGFVDITTGCGIVGESCTGASSEACY